MVLRALCENGMGSSIFSDMIQLSCTSMTRASLLAFHWQKVQTEKNVPVSHGSAYWDCTSWLFPANPEAPSLAHIFINPNHRRLVWRQWWIQPVDTIKLLSRRHTTSTCPCQSPYGFPYLIWYSHDGLGVWHILMLRWRPARHGKGFCHALRCDTRWPSLLCCR